MEADYVKVKVDSWAELLAMVVVVRSMLKRRREHTLDLDLVPHSCIVDLARHLEEYDASKVAKEEGPTQDA